MCDNLYYCDNQIIVDIKNKLLDSLYYKKNQKSTKKYKKNKKNTLFLKKPSSINQFLTIY